MPKVSTNKKKPDLPSPISPRRQIHEISLPPQRRVQNKEASNSDNVCRPALNQAPQSLSLQNSPTQLSAGTRIPSVLNFELPPLDHIPEDEVSVFLYNTLVKVIAVIQRLEEMNVANLYDLAVGTLFLSYSVTQFFLIRYFVEAKCRS